jgi:hypothetical protein
MLSPHGEVVNAAVDIAAGVVDLLGAAVRADGPRACVPAAWAHTFARNLRALTSYDFKGAWHGLLTRVFPALFRAFGRPLVAQLFQDVVRALGLMYDVPQFALRAELRAVLAVAVRTAGIEPFLAVLPLNLGDAADAGAPDTAPRPWLLPVLVEGAELASLDHALRHFVPLIELMQQRARAFVETGRAAEAKECDVMRDQLWALLERCCVLPIDGLRAGARLARYVVAQLGAEASAVQTQLLVRVLGCLHNLAYWYRRAAHPEQFAALSEFDAALRRSRRYRTVVPLRVRSGDAADHSTAVDEELDRDDAADDGEFAAGSGAYDGEAAAAAAAEFSERCADTRFAHVQGQREQARLAREAAEVALLDAAAVSPKDAAALVAELGKKYARQLLPVLFNHLGNLPAASPLEAPLLAAASQLAATTPTAARGDLLGSVLTQLQQAVERVAAAGRGGSASGDCAAALVDAQRLMELAGAFADSTAACGGDDELRQLCAAIDAVVHGRAPTALQKRAYGALRRLLTPYAALAGARGQLALPTAVRDAVARSLLNDFVTCHPAAKRQRLECLRVLLRAYSPVDAGALGRSMSGEVILCTKDPSAKTRAAAYHLLIDLCRRALAPVSASSEMSGIDETACAGMPLDATPFLTTVVVGLAGTTPRMVSATLNALAELLRVFSAQLLSSFARDLLGACAVLLRMPSTETVRSALRLVRVAAVTLPDEILRPVLPDVLAAVFAAAPGGGVGAARLRVSVKLLLQRLLARYPADVLARFVPERHLPLLRSVGRSVRKAEAARERARASRSSAAPAARRHTVRFAADEDADSPVDLADMASVSRGVEAPTARKRGRDDIWDEIDGGGDGSGDDNGAGGSDDADFEFDEAGRLVLHDDDDDDDDDGGGDGGDGKEGGDKLGRGGDQGARAPARAARAREPRSEKRKPEAIGAAYRSAKAGGDMRRAGQPDPFAYVPLQAKHMNRRNRRQAVEHFKDVVVSRGGRGGNKRARR